MTRKLILIGVCIVFGVIGCDEKKQHDSVPNHEMRAEKFHFLQDDKDYIAYNRIYCAVVIVKGSQIKGLPDNYEYPLKEDQETWMISPDDVPYKIPATSAQKAIDMGYRFQNIPCRK